MISKTEAFQTSDGELFPERKDAVKHEAASLRKGEVTEWVDGFWYRGIEDSAVVEAICEDVEGLMKALNPKLFFDEEPGDA